MTTNIKPKVTVLITVRDSSPALRYAIESVLWQTLKNFELWVISDGCRADVDAVIASFRHDPRVHLYTLSTPSRSESMLVNDGVRLARGQFFAYLNNDDIWLPNHLQALTDHLENSKADVAFSVMQIIHSSSVSNLMIPKLPLLPKLPESTAVIHKKNIFETVNIGSDALGNYSPINLFRRAQIAGCTFELLPVVTSLRFDRAMVMSGKKTPQSSYVAQIQNDPWFMNSQLSKILVEKEYNNNSFRGHLKIYRLTQFLFSKLYMVAKKLTLIIPRRPVSHSGMTSAKARPDHQQKDVFQSKGIIG